MKILKGITDIFTGGASSVAAGVVDIVTEFIPSESKKTDLKLKLEGFLHKEKIELLEKTNEANQIFNKRISDMEGTAKDLKAIPILGSIIIFLRGCQRPLWGFACMFIDYQVLSANWEIADDPQRKALVIIINILVLTFLFGERTIKNLEPLILKVFGMKK